MILPPPTSTLFPYTTLFRSPQDPPDRLDVVVAVGDVRVVVVEPEGDPLGKLLPIALVLEDALATEGVELLDAVGLDVLFALEAELLLDLELDGETVGVPASLPGDLASLRHLEPADQVLDGAREDVMNPRPPIGGRGSLEEDEGRPLGGGGLDLLEEPLLLP